jgi:hypothetical protein
MSRGFAAYLDGRRMPSATSCGGLSDDSGERWMSMKVTLELKRAWRTGGQHSSNAVLAIKACQGLPVDVVQRRVAINGPGCTRLTPFMPAIRRLSLTQHTFVHLVGAGGVHVSAKS